MESPEQKLKHSEKYEQGKVVRVFKSPQEDINLDENSRDQYGQLRSYDSTNGRLYILDEETKERTSFSPEMSESEELHDVHKVENEGKDE